MRVNRGKEIKINEKIEAIDYGDDIQRLREDSCKGILRAVEDVCRMKREWEKR